MSSGWAKKYTKNIYIVRLLVPIPCSPGNPCLALIATRPPVTQCCSRSTRTAGALVIRVGSTQPERSPAVRPVGQQLVDEAVGVPKLAARTAGTAGALPSPAARGSVTDRLVEPPKALI